MHGTGVCGTDLHIVAGEYATTPPLTLGHEVTGVVRGVGDRADARWIGERVVCETYFSTCGSCGACRSGRPNRCRQRRSIGTHVDGGFAASLVVPIRNLHAVPTHVGEHAAALAEPLACVCNCLLDPQIVGLGDRVLVVGPGPIGLLAAQVARACGGEVTLVGLPSDDARLAIGAALGFERVTSTGGVEADVVVECSGTAAGATACLEAAVPGARVVQIGVFGKAVAVPLDRIFERELTITSGFASTPRSWLRAMDLMAARAVEVDPLLTGVARLDDWASVFDDLRAGRGLKVVLDPRLG